MRAAHLLLLSCLGAGAGAAAVTPLLAATASAKDARFETKSAGDKVVFTLTPKKVKEGRFLFALRVDTHEGELAELDLDKSVRLHVGERSIAPARVPKLRGHHAGGTLAFALDAVPERFSITITAIPDEPELRLDWP